MEVVDLQISKSGDTATLNVGVLYRPIYLRCWGQEAEWFVEEPGSEAARQLWRNHAHLLAPDLIVAEVCNTMWRKIRIGQASPAQADEVVVRMRHGVLELWPTLPLAARAMALSLALDHPAYDCFYLALAERE